MASTQTLKSKLYATVPVRNDYKLHLNAVRIDGQEFLDIREFIPSQNNEGRGLLIDNDALPHLLEELSRYAEYHGLINRAVTPGPGQGKLDL